MSEELAETIRELSAAVEDIHEALLPLHRAANTLERIDDSLRELATNSIESGFLVVLNKEGEERVATALETIAECVSPGRYGGQHEVDPALRVKGGGG